MRFANKRKACRAEIQPKYDIIGEWKDRTRDIMNKKIFR